MHSNWACPLVHYCSLYGLQNSIQTTLWLSLETVGQRIALAASVQRYNLNVVVSAFSCWESLRTVLLFKESTPLKLDGLDL